MNINISTAVAMLLLANVSFANCTKPAYPAVPNGATSTEAQMLEGQATVKDYIAKSNDYLACLTEAEKNAGEETVDQKEDRVDAYNTAVDEQQKLADRFNEEIRKWKAQGS